MIGRLVLFVLSSGKIDCYEIVNVFINVASIYPLAVNISGSTTNRVISESHFNGGALKRGQTIHWILGDIIVDLGDKYGNNHTPTNTFNTTRF